MPTIFLSYRRSDSGGYSGRLADALEKTFGAGSVFQDVETIAPGSDFTRAINAAIARCLVCIVLIGDTWASERTTDGRLRLDDANDFVRIEAASALRGRKPVLPVLVEGAKMPDERTLPADLKPLARVQALELSDSRWEYDVERVVHAIRSLTGRSVPFTRRRRLVLGGIGALLAGVVGVAVYRALTRPAEIAGRWKLPNGNFWYVVQDGTRVTIEETHYESKQVWKRGSGRMRKDRVRFRLDLVYGGPRLYDGELRLSPDGNMLSGDVHDSVSGAKDSLILVRIH